MCFVLAFVLRGLLAIPACLCGRDWLGSVCCFGWACARIQFEVPLPMCVLQRGSVPGFFCFWVAGPWRCMLSEFSLWAELAYVRVACASCTCVLRAFLVFTLVFLPQYFRDSPDREFAHERNSWGSPWEELQQIVFILWCSRD